MRVNLKTDIDSELITWPLTSLVRETALVGMAQRAEFESRAVGQGLDIAAVHGEAIQAYPEYRRLLYGARRLAMLIGQPFGGRAADLGSGTGVGAAILSTMPEITEILAIEYSEPYVTQIMPIVFERFGAERSKIYRIVGDFNDLRLDAASLDVVIEIGAFHHSESLSVTLREARRVLRSGGLLVAIDRAWPDELSDADLEAKLDRQLSPELKRKYGISETQSFTRRDWGEHEYRVGQWLAALTEAGFEAVALMQYRPPIRGIGRILPMALTFTASLWLAARAYRRGARRLRIYGFNPTRAMFFCVRV